MQIIAIATIISTRVQITSNSGVSWMECFAAYAIIPQSVRHIAVSVVSVRLIAPRVGVGVCLHWVGGWYCLPLTLLYVFCFWSQGFLAIVNYFIPVRVNSLLGFVAEACLLAVVVLAREC